MLKWIVISVFLMLYVNTNCQELAHLKSHQDTIKKLTALIQKDQILSSPAVGAGGRPSKPFYRFIYLLSMVDTKELVEMVNDSSRYVRIYGYLGLLHRNYHLIEKVKRSLSKDAALIETINGCNAETMPIAKAVKNMSKWHYRKGFDLLLKDWISKEYVRGFPITTLLAE